MIKKKCFTFVEILAVLSIVGILIVGTVVGINTVWQNNRIDICESELREFTLAVKSYYTDYAKPQISPDENYERYVNEMIDLLNDKYLPWEIEILEIAPDKKSISLITKLKTDPWNSKYEFDVYTYSGDDATSKTGLVIVSSNGPDAASNRVEYKNGDFGDDIIAVVDPNS